MLKDINLKHKSMPVYFKETWQARHIIVNLFRNQVFGAHRRKMLGSVWFFLDPLFQLLIWSFVFLFVFKINVEYYPIYLFSAITCWTFISSALSEGCNAIRSMGNFLLEVNVPKIALVLTILLRLLFYMGLQFIVLLVMMLIMGVPLTIYMLYLPLIVLVILVFSLGGSLLSSVLGFYSQDVGNLIIHLIRLWWFLSPGLYPLSRIPEKYHSIYTLNPMCGIFISFRNCLLYGKPPDWDLLLISVVFAVALIIIGFAVFYRVEPRFTRNIY